MCKFRRLVFFFTFILLLAGCRSDIEFVESSFRPGHAEVSLSGSNLSMNFPSSSGSASVDLDASGKWTASFVNDRAKDWCSLSTESGKRGKATISVSVKENTDYDQRSASINFVCGDVQRTIVVTQKQKDALLLTSNRLDIGNNGGNITVEVKANVSFDYIISESAQPWIKLVGTKSLATSQLTFVVDANEDIEKRDGSITVTSSVGTETVRIYQDGATPTLIVSASQIDLPARDTTFQVEVRSNVNVTVDIPDSCAWIREIQTKAISTNTLYFTVDKNDTSKEREGIITFRNDAMSLVEEVHVFQGSGTILFSPSQLVVPGIEGFFYLFVAGQNPNHYQFDYNADWITIQDAEIAELGLCYRCSVKAQSSKQQRKARIQIHYSFITDPCEIIIIQHAPCSAVSYTNSGKQAVSPIVLEAAQQAFIYWGDGTYQPYSQGLVHEYPESRQFTITVTSDPFTTLRVGNLPNNVFFDFSHLTVE